MISEPQSAQRNQALASGANITMPLQSPCRAVICAVGIVKAAMSNTLYTLSQILLTLQELKERIHPAAWADTPLPIVAAPGSWIEQLAIDLGHPGEIPESIHGCSVVRKDELPDPVLITHDGKVYRITPHAGTLPEHDTPQ